MKNHPRLTDAENLLPRDHFGDSPAMADELGHLVCQGIKTASCWAATAPSTVTVGQCCVIVDGRGEPLCIIETLSLTRRKYHDVDADFAWAEGEGDRSLDYWRREHRAYFERNGGFAEDMDVICERFRLIKVF